MQIRARGFSTFLVLPVQCISLSSPCLAQTAKLIELAGEPVLSPDGKTIVFALRRRSLEG